MAAANDFDGFGGDTARSEPSGVVSRFMRNQPSYSTFDEEARIRRRDPGYLQQDRLQSLVLIGGFVSSALLLFIAGFVSAFLLFDDVAPSDVAVADPDVITAPPVVETAQAPEAPVDFPPQRDFVSTANAEADSDVPPEPAPEVAAARALADSGEPVDAPGSPVVTLEQAVKQQQPAIEPQATTGGQAAQDEPVQLVRATPEPVAQPSTSTASTPPARGYVLQFGAFGDRGNAQGLVNLLKQKVGRVWIVEGRASSGADLFFVRGGSYESRDEAAAAARKLWQSDRIDSFVRSVERG